MLVSPGSTTIVPLASATWLVGALSVRHRGELASSRAERAAMVGFAAQVVLAMQAAEERARAEQLAVLEDRERIARSLNENVIGRLFATGLGLYGFSATHATRRGHAG